MLCRRQRACVTRCWASMTAAWQTSPSARAPCATFPIPFLLVPNYACRPGSPDCWYSAGGPEDCDSPDMSSRQVLLSCLCDACPGTCLATCWLHMLAAQVRRCASLHPLSTPSPYPLTTPSLTHRSCALSAPAMHSLIKIDAWPQSDCSISGAYPVLVWRLVCRAPMRGGQRWWQARALCHAHCTRWFCLCHAVL